LGRDRDAIRDSVANAIYSQFVSLPADQLAAIRHAVKQRTAGGIRLHGVLPLAASNLVYIGELLALLLLTRWLRLVGVALSFGLLVPIELAARELMFGVLMLNLVGLFVPRVTRSVRRLLRAASDVRSAPIRADARGPHLRE
jgi:hypothetical protein